MDALCLRRQIGIRSESDCLLGQLRMTFKISASDAGSKVGKSGGDVNGEGECGDAVTDEEVRDRLKLRYFVSKEKSKAVSK